MTYTDVFGGPNISPTQTSYLALSISANTTLSWPFELGSTNIAAYKIDLTASVGSLSLTMPDARLVTPGQDIFINNVGAQTVTIKDNGGTNIGSVASGQAWFFYLRDNSTAAGQWRSIQMGTGTSSATAASLAGFGLTPITTTLNQFAPYTAHASDYLLLLADQAGFHTSTGGATTFFIDVAANLDEGWFVFIRNDGSGNLLLEPDGAETIDGATNKTLAPTESCIVLCDGAAFHTVGFGRSVISTTTAATVDIAGNGNYTLSADEVAAVIQNCVGALTGARTLFYGTNPGYWFVFNNTSGAFSTTFKTNGADTGVVVNQGSYAIIRSDGTNMTVAVTATSGTVTSVATGTDLSGGPITSTGTINHANSGVVAATYGSASTSVTLAINARGHITAASASTITAAYTSLTGVPDALTSIGVLTPAADRVPYYTAAATAALATFTAQARTLLAAATAAAQRVVITPLTTNGDIWTYTGGIDARLGVGTTGQVLGVVAGLPAWTGVPIRAVRIQTFTANGTYTPHASMVYCQIECVGGGGGGGGIDGDGNSEGAGGGGAGGYARKISTAADIGASQAVTVGAGGAAGASGNNPGGNGGDTSVGAICIGKGGTGGEGGATSDPGNGGAGGVAGTGDFTPVGAPGGSGIYAGAASAFALSGYGGSSIYGGGGVAKIANAATVAGAAGSNYGGGGSGGASHGDASNAAGGAGAAGVVIVTEYCSA